MTPGLEVRNLTAGYSGVPAVRGVTIEVAPGEVVALLGANGAGKTTTLLSIAGEVEVQEGEVRFAGAPLTGPLHRRARRGLGLVAEGRSVFPSLSVENNLALGRASVDDVYSLAPELRALKSRGAGLLSGGEQQILAVTRIIAARPSLLLADELSLGLAPMLVGRMLQLCRVAADNGAAVLLVEQHVARILEVADRAYVMRHGEVQLEGSAEELRADSSRVREVYLPGATPVTEQSGRKGR